MNGKLARVHWQMGQTLLPDHFVAQEDALLEDVSLRFRLHGVPAYGFAALRWNPKLLAEGVLSISAATLVTPAGVLVDVPGNAAVTPLNLNVPGTATVTAYLHLLDAPAEGGGGPSGEHDVARLSRQLVLGVEQTCPGAVESLRLAELRKDPDGVWQLTDRVVPPLLCVGTTPFLMAALDDLGHALEGFQYKLAMDSASYLSGGGLYTVKQCLKSVYRTQRLLANVRGQVHPHPYFVYEALKELYVDVAFYRDAAPKDITEPYQHDQLAACLAKILEPLQEQMRLAEKRSPYLPFELRDGVYRLELSAELKAAKDVYFLIQKNQISRTVSLKEFKVSSPSRLSMIHKLALEGIPVRKVDRPVLAHSFGPEVDFYQLGLTEEWQQALREGAVAFYHRAAEFSDLEFYLYWYAA